jgi:hypothetical protein
MFRSLLVVACLMVAVPAVASPCKGGPRRDPCVSKCNPDGRTSITLTAGLGSLDGLNQGRDADITALGVSLVYPAAQNMSLLAGYNHSKTEWNGAATRYGLTDWNTDLFTVGLRFYLGR